MYFLYWLSAIALLTHCICLSDYMSLLVWFCVFECLSVWLHEFTCLNVCIFQLWLYVFPCLTVCIFLACIWDKCIYIFDSLYLLFWLHPFAWVTLCICLSDSMNLSVWLSVFVDVCKFLDNMESAGDHFIYTFLHRPSNLTFHLNM